MKIESVAWTRFRIPFLREFVTAHGPIRIREGLLLRLKVGGIEGYGEASPVPGFEGPSLIDTLIAIEALGPQLVGRELDEVGAILGRARGILAGAPLAECAVDMACWDVTGKRAGVPLASMWGGDSLVPVRVNATVGVADAEGAAVAASLAVEAGFRCIKLKVGVAASREAEIARVAGVRAALGPLAQLRLDANGCWDRDTAVELILALEAFDLELVEQPVTASDLEGLAEVRARVRVPIGADESVGNPEQARRVIEAGAADVLVVKPMAAGGLTASLEILQLVRDAGLRALVTTSIDSGAGIAAAIHLSAMLPEPRLACGLATASLLAADLAQESVAIIDGAAVVPPRAGLGFAPSEADLLTYTDRWHELVQDRRSL
ncbi:MAG: o-succinylbenzoate synthase [Chloroflexi bacterium]|nr:o-succinylbenzoate synthase [Chloroflexota bacterium]